MKTSWLPGFPLSLILCGKPRRSVASEAQTFDVRLLRTLNRNSSIDQEWPGNAECGECRIDMNKPHVRDTHDSCMMYDMILYEMDARLAMLAALGRLTFQWGNLSIACCTLLHVVAHWKVVCKSLCKSHCTGPRRVVSRSSREVL
jgi:hypothetical protein